MSTLRRHRLDEPYLPAHYLTARLFCTDTLATNQAVQLVSTVLQYCRFDSFSFIKFDSLDAESQAESQTTNLW